jgi:apolipoprotein N-acyltransferase
MSEALLLRADASTPARGVPGFADAIGRLGGWRRAALAVGLGLLAAPAMPPLGLVPLLLPSFTGLIWLLDGPITRRRAWLDGWLWGFGLLLPNMSWVALSMFVDLARFWWMVVPAAVGLPAGMSLFPAFGTWLYRLVRCRGIARIGLFACCCVLADYLRGHIPWGGFPWVLIGYAWSSDQPGALEMLQAVSLIGTYGLGFITILLATLPALTADALRPGRSALPALAAAAAGLALLGGLLLWGGERLAHGVTGTAPGVMLRIIHTDLPNRDDGEDAPERLRKVFDLAGKPGAESVSAQIWPESSVDYLLNEEPSLREAIGRLAAPNGVILTGAVLGTRGPPGPDFRNSVAAVAADGQIIASYDKAHLVPFGEYFPMRWLFGMIPVVAETPGLTSGPGPRTLHLPNLPPVGPMVCYEAIFPHAVIDEQDRPAWLLNDTNDAWFGRSLGPYQHFAESRLRSIEEGLPLIRAANGGISGVVDSYGRILQALPLGQESALDVKLPVALAADHATPYGRLGDSPLLLIVVAALLVRVVYFLNLAYRRY